MKFKGLCLIFSVLLSLGVSGCGTNSKTIKVGASSTPHALILEEAKNYIETKGYKLEIVVFNDYVLPNYSLENGELDANYFQHEPYLNEFNAANNTHLVSVMKVHFEPMGIYSGKKNTLVNYVTGDTIIVPSDKSNYDRAIDLLNANGIKNANIVQVEAQNIPLMLSDCDFAVVNGNYALSSNIGNRCIVTEDKNSDIAKQMANIIAVKSGNENTNKTKVLIESLRQKNIADFIKDTFGNSVIAMEE